MSDLVEIPVIIETVLGVEVARGYAPLSLLARISQADIFDAETNPRGTQRDLSPKHARDAYEYVRSEDLAFWPEVFLAARDQSVIKIRNVPGCAGLQMMQIDMGKIFRSRTVCISRVDGNHRLHFADGLHEGFPAIDKKVSFCVAINITEDDEIKIFRDINNNQRRMNTSHLDNIKIRLSETNSLKVRDPNLYIANRLAEDDDSALSGFVHLGGAKDVSKFIPLRTLKSGIGYMMSRPNRLTALEEIEIQIKLIKNYFNALKKWVPDAWSNHREFLLLRGAGFWGACFLGAEVIDRCLAQNTYKEEDMLRLLKSGRNWDWSRSGDFQGYSGRGGAVKIRDSVVQELPDIGGNSLKALAQQIAKEIN